MIASLYIQAVGVQRALAKGTGLIRDLESILHEYEFTANQPSVSDDLYSPVVYRRICATADEALVVQTDIETSFRVAGVRFKDQGRLLLGVSQLSASFVLVSDVTMRTGSSGRVAVDVLLQFKNRL